jgi:hypothetical protein
LTFGFLSCREEKRLRRKEDTLLRELRIFLRDIWAKINRESKFFMFRLVIDGILVPQGADPHPLFKRSKGKYKSFERVKHLPSSPLG